MKKVKITAMRRACYPDLMAEYENPLETPCEVILGQSWVSIDGEKPEGLDILHESKSGRLSTYIVRGSAAEVSHIVEKSNPAYFDVLPLSLEEIFIYELGGVNHEVKNIIL